MGDGVVPLSLLDLGLGAGLLLLLALLSLRHGLGLERRIAVAGLRMCVQLALIGLVLERLFAIGHPALVLLVALVMVGIAGWEIDRRQKRRFRGAIGVLLGTGAMSASCLLIAIVTLAVLLQPDPWYSPRYAIPLLGMMLGNTMNGVALALDGLTTGAGEQRRLIEGRLLLGMSAGEAIRPLQAACLRTALTPILNQMSVAGLVALPGMMTGQILGGSPPMVAVAYQILIMFLIAGSVGLGTLCAIMLGARILFDERERLRLDRLR
jgi:putative ABC transport system permease protein